MTKLTAAEKTKVTKFDAELDALKTQVANLACDELRILQMKMAAIAALIDKQKEAEAFVCTIVRRLGHDPVTERWTLDATTMQLTRVK